MNPASIAYVIGALFLVTGGSMILPVICSIIYGEDDLFALSISAVVIFLIGLPLRWFFGKITNSPSRTEFSLPYSAGW